MSRPQQQNADFNQVPMFSPSNFGNFKQGISHNPMYSAGDVDIVHQKERLLLSRYPYSDFSTNDKIVKSAPYHQQQNPWSHEMTEMASRGLNNVQLRQSYSEVYFCYYYLKVTYFFIVSTYLGSWTTTF